MMIEMSGKDFLKKFPNTSERLRNIAEDAESENRLIQVLKEKRGYVGIKVGHFIYESKTNSKLSGLENSLNTIKKDARSKEFLLNQKIGSWENKIAQLENEQTLIAQEIEIYKKKISEAQKGNC